MKARLVLLAIAVSAIVALAPATAGAQEPAGLTKVVPVSGKSKSGKQFNGTYAINRFATSGGRLVSVGTLKGRLGNRRVTERGVRMPATLTSGAAAAAAAQPPLPPIPNACEVLDLRLGPITLDLLGLVVRTNRIQVRIDAVPGPGNLLGNLLCAITGLLDPQGTAANQLAPALNSILALVPRSG
jgi:hypothetical protein